MESFEKENAYFNGLKNLCALYDKVRLAIVLTESLDEEHKMYIAPINQMRCALDHVFTGISNVANEEKSTYELKEVQEHLTRAGYDALELLTIILGNQIVKSLRKYDTDVISSVFPIYYQQIKPQLIECKKQISILRTEKTVNSEKSFLAYFEQIQKMIEFNKAVVNMIPSLDEFSAKRRKEICRKWLWGIIATIIGGIIVWLITTHF